MALLFIDSFDQYNKYTDPGDIDEIDLNGVYAYMDEDRWFQIGTTGVDNSPTGGARTGTQWLRKDEQDDNDYCALYIGDDYGDSETIIMGFAVCATTTLSGWQGEAELAWIGYYDGINAVRHLSVSFNTSTGAVWFNIDGTQDRSKAVLETCDGILTAGDAGWKYFEIKFVKDPNHGSIEFRVDGEQVGIQDELPTTYTYNSIFVALYGRHQVCMNFDDYYICDGRGGKFADFLGPIKLITKNPNADGSITQFTPVGETTNAAAVKQYPVDDSDYNESSTDNHQDLFTYEALPDTITKVMAAATWCYARRDDGAIRSIRQSIKQGTDETIKPKHYLGPQYRWFWDIYPFTPVGLDWTIFATDEIEAGYKVRTS